MLRCAGTGWVFEVISLVVRLVASILPGTVCRKVNGGFDVVLSGLLLEGDGERLSALRISLRDVLVPLEATCHGEPDFISSASGSTRCGAGTSCGCCSAAFCCCLLRSRCVSLLMLLELGVKDERPVDMFDT